MGLWARWHLRKKTKVEATVVEATMAGMRQAMEQRRITSRELVQQSLTRIARYENQLNVIITLNRPTGARTCFSAPRMGLPKRHKPIGSMLSRSPV